MTKREVVTCVEVDRTIAQAFLDGYSVEQIAGGRNQPRHQIEDALRRSLVPRPGPGKGRKGR